MAKNVIDKLISLIKKKAVGTLDIVTCDFSVKTFIDKGSQDHNFAYKEASKIFYDLTFKGSHPTMNPFFDVFLTYETKDIREAFQRYIKENSFYNIDECTDEQDVLTLYVSLELLAINCLPLVEDKSLKLESAAIQTALFKYKIEG